MNTMTFAHFMTKRTTGFSRGLNYKTLFAAALSDAHRLVKRYGGNVLTEGLVAARAKGMEELARRMKEAQDIDARIERERSVVRSIVSSAVAMGYTVSLNDGEEWTVKRSTSVQEVMQAIMTTESDSLRFRTQDQEVVGGVYLIYGNSASEVMADWSDNELTNKILTNAVAQCDRYAAKGW